MSERNDEHAASAQRFYPNARFPNEIDALDVPEAYVSVAKGNCLEPAYRDGDHLIFSKSSLPLKGDYVGIWFLPDVVPDGEAPRQIKRLSSDSTAGFQLPWHATEVDEPEPFVHFEMFNPPRKLRVPASKIVAMHKVLGMAESNGDGTAVPSALKNRLPNLPWLRSVVPGMISHRVQDDLCEPLLTAGDYVIIDTSLKTPENDKLFLVQWSTGNRQVMQLGAHEFTNSEGKFTGWMIAPFRRPRTRDAADMWTQHMRMIDWCSDGPYTAEGIRTILVGQVVGRCNPEGGANTK